MIVFPCPQCQTSLSADESQKGQKVRCPQCRGVLSVPTPPPAPATLSAVPASHAAALAVGAAQRPPLGGLLNTDPASPNRSMGRSYGFHCVYCSSRLEAHDAMAAKEGQCPTCGSTITVPILDRYGRLIDPLTQKVIKPDPHPVHAYAAAGDRAPQIVKDADGNRHIRCPRCGSIGEITLNNCRACGLPFTMEGTVADSGTAGNGYAVASLVLGILSLPMFCTVVLGALAVAFGFLGMNAAGKSGRGRGMSIAGILMGGLSLTFFLLMSLGML